MITGINISAINLNFHQSYNLPFDSYHVPSRSKAFSRLCIEIYSKVKIHLKKKKVSSLA